MPPESVNGTRGWPAPPMPEQLAAVTDLGEDAARFIAEALNTLVADAFALYVKTRNFHRHLFGSHLHDYHLLLGEQAEQILGSVDVLAERDRKIGGTTIRSISRTAQLRSVRDDDKTAIPARTMLQALIEDNVHLARQQRTAHQICTECGDIATTGILETFLDQTERRIWVLFETLRESEVK